MKGQNYRSAALFTVILTLLKALSTSSSSLSISSPPRGCEKIGKLNRSGKHQVSHHAMDFFTAFLTSLKVRRCAISVRYRWNNGRDYFDRTCRFSLAIKSPISSANSIELVVDTGLSSSAFDSLVIDDYCISKKNCCD